MSRRGWLAWALWGAVMIIVDLVSDGATWIATLAFPSYFVIASALGLPDRPRRSPEREL